EHRVVCYLFFFQAEDGIRDRNVTGVQTCALPIYHHALLHPRRRPAAGASDGGAARRRRPPRRLAPGRPAARRAGAAILLRGAAEIGRASCRERVEISVVAAGL